jgi:hypothetical protein
LCICPQVDVEAPSIIDAVLVNGTTIGASDDVDSSCVDDDGDDIVVSWIAPVSGCIRFSTQGSDFDSLLYIQTCDGAPNELACDDDLAGLSNAEIDLSVTEGTQYYIVVDGYDPSQWGDYVLNAWTCP